MRKMLGAVTVAALAFTAGVAFATEMEVSGEVQNIDATMKTFVVGDEVLQWSDNATGVKLEELQDGDKVKVMFDKNPDGHNDVMEIMKEE